MSGRIRPVIKKEFRQILRDIRTLGMLIAFPGFLLIMYGYALNFDVKHISLAVFDQENSRMSREFYQKFLHSEYFDLKYLVSREGEIDRLLDEGRVKIVLVIPPDFSRNILSGRETVVQVLIDGEESLTASTGFGYVNAIVLSYSQSIILETIRRSGWPDMTMPLDFRPRMWYNPELRSSLFFIPGLMAFILMVTVVISTSFSVVRERERETMEQILVSPVKPFELILGKTIPYVLISLASSHLVLLFGRLLFGVSVKGSYGILLLAIILFLVGGLGLGLLISTIARTQQAAFMISVLSTILPTFILSGFVFPIRNMPPLIQAITYILPARYFLSVLRSIMLKGARFETFWEQFLFLFFFALVAIILSAWRMRRIRQ